MENEKIREPKKPKEVQTIKEEELKLVKKNLSYLFSKVKTLEDKIRKLEEEVKNNEIRKKIIKEKKQAEEIKRSEVEVKKEEVKKTEVEEKERKEGKKQKKENKKKKKTNETNEIKKRSTKLKSLEKEVTTIKKDLSSLTERIESIEKKLEERIQSAFLEDELRVQKQKEAKFFNSISKIISNFIEFKFYVEELKNRPMYIQIDHSNFSLFENVFQLVSNFTSFIREKWILYKLNKSLKELNKLLFDERFIDDEKYALVYEYFKSPIEEEDSKIESMKNYFNEKEVKLLSLFKKILKNETFELSESDLNFYKEYVKQRENTLFDVNDLHKKEKIKINLRR